MFRKQVFTFVFKPTADEFSVCAAVSNKLSLCSEKKADKVSLCAANRKHVFTVCSRCLTHFLFEQQVLTSFTLCSKQLTSFHCVQQIVPQVPTIWYTKQNKTKHTATARHRNHYSLPHQHRKSRDYFGLKVSNDVRQIPQHHKTIHSRLDTLPNRSGVQKT